MISYICYCIERFCKGVSVQSKKKKKAITEFLSCGSSLQTYMVLIKMQFRQKALSKKNFSFFFLHLF